MPAIRPKYMLIINKLLSFAPNQMWNFKTYPHTFYPIKFFPNQNNNNPTIILPQQPHTNSIRYWKRIFHTDSIYTIHIYKCEIKLNEQFSILLLVPYYMSIESVNLTKTLLPVSIIRKCLPTIFVYCLLVIVWNLIYNVNWVIDNLHMQLKICC